MKKLFFIVALLYAQANLFSQPYYKYWIQFTDKNNSPYSIGNPSAYLSARAIQRRTKYHIPVQYNDLPPNLAYIDSVVSKGVILLNRSRWFNAISINAISAADTATAMAKIRALPFVKSSKFVTIANPLNKNGFIETTNNHSPLQVDTFNYAASYNQVHMIGIDCLNNMGFRGQGKRIAQIDSRFGIANQLPAFDSLYNRSGVLGTWDFVWEDPNVYDDTNNADVHGQMVLSCMAGNLPGQFLGDAVDANYYLLRSEDAETEYQVEDDNWASAAEYADSAGADVITSSLGYTTFDDTTTNYTYADMNGKVAIASIAATIAVEKGMVVCVAAGNEGGSPWQYISSPGDADSILTVGAVDYYGDYAAFSSTGPTSDGRIKPDVVAQGEFTILASPSGGITAGSGTSFATPLIAGAAACLWQSDSNANCVEIMNAIRQSASQYTHPDSLLGYGIPNFCVAHQILTGIAENKPVSAISHIYPDPFTDQVTVSFFSSIVQNVNVRMFNTLGQIVNQKEWKVAANGNTLINLDGLQGLSNGIYLVVLTDENGSVFTEKVVKQ